MAHVFLRMGYEHGLSFVRGKRFANFLPKPWYLPRVYWQTLSCPGLLPLHNSRRGYSHRRRRLLRGYSTRDHFQDLLWTFKTCSKLCSQIEKTAAKKKKKKIQNRIYCHQEHSQMWYNYRYCFYFIAYGENGERQREPCIPQNWSEDRFLWNRGLNWEAARGASVHHDM